MKILVFGSLNVDRVYSVERIARPGETVMAGKMALFCGGKGFNQALALRRAGNPVLFAGAVGPDGGMLLDALDAEGIDRSRVRVADVPTGHAVIQVDGEGQNCIVVEAGANGRVTAEQMDDTLRDFSPGDLIVTQNEIPNMPLLLEKARERGMITAFNPSPASPGLLPCLANTDYLLINETEGAALTGRADPGGILSYLHSRYPAMNTVLTLGEKGSVFRGADGVSVRVGILPVRAADATAAGDTFTGYFLSSVIRGAGAGEALRLAAIASGLAVSRPGAGPSIPEMAEVLEMGKTEAASRLRPEAFLPPAGVWAE